MVLSARGLNEGDRSLDARWQRKAKIIKQTVANVDLLSEIEKRRWDLDTPTRRPTGAHVDSNWESHGQQFEPRSQDRRRHDARELPTIRDGEY